MISRRYQKHLYDQTALLIFHLQKNGRITGQEAEILERLLDQLILKRRCPDLVPLLQGWAGKSRDEQLDALVRDVLLRMDFRDQSIYNDCIREIEGLLDSRP